MDLNALEKQFHSDGYRLGMEAVEAGSTKHALREAVQKLYNLIDEVIHSFYEFAEKHTMLPACKKGCNWCCHQPVFAQLYELDLMNDFIGKKFDADTKKRISTRASDKIEMLSNLEGDDLFHSKFPCPLLHDGVCMVYAVRPMACRIYLSKDANSCRIFFNAPANSDSIPALLNFPMRMGRMLNEGFRAALKAGGLKVDELRIEEGLEEMNT